MCVEVDGRQLVGKCRQLVSAGDASLMEMRLKVGEDTAADLPSSRRPETCGLPMLLRGIVIVL